MNLVPRRVLTTVLVAMALAASTLVLVGGATSAAEAAWSRPGSLVHYKLCKQSVDGGEAWLFRSRVRKHADTEDARAWLAVYRKGDRIAGRKTGWLDDGGVETFRVRVRRAPTVRLVVSQEAGDLDSDLGTSAEAVLLKPKRVKSCG